MLELLEGERVFELFEEISSVPRGSYHNEQISGYLVDFAVQHGLAYIQDDAWNVCIRKPGSKGFENRTPVILQGHMDMVCECEPGVTHDFEKEGLDLYIEGDFIKARGTTLGGDDGIALAMGLAILEDESLVHPPLEVLFTTDEEVGLLGASAFDMSQLNGKYLINIDSEEEGSLLISSAGGQRTQVEFAFSDRGSYEGNVFEVVVQGLQGGHSGTEIDKDRYNATFLLNHLLATQLGQIALISLEGGDKDNVIPAYAKAVLVVDDEEGFQTEINQYKKMLQEDLAMQEPGLDVTWEKTAYSGEVLTKEDTRRVVEFIKYCPNGVMAMSSDIKDMVETSLNLGITHIGTVGNGILGYSLRSQKNESRDALHERMEDLAQTVNATVSKSGVYGAWDVREDSKLLDVMSMVYEEQYGEPPVITGIHAGLECSILGQEGDMDMVSIGADTYDIHSYKEKMSISSSRRVFHYVKSILTAICGQNM